MQKANLTSMEKLGYSVDEVSEILPLGKTTIYSLIRSGRWPSLFICGRRIITDSAIKKLIAEAEADFESLKNQTLKNILTNPTVKE